MEALPSAVSVLKEKTVTYLRCHSRGFEKVIWPIACMVTLVVSIILLAVALGTQNWMQLDVLGGNSEQRGSIVLGLLRGSHTIAYAEMPIDVNTISDSYFLFDKLPLNYLARFNATFGLSAAAILISLLNLCITLLNSYQSVTVWWRGPSMMYLLSLFASVCGLTAVGVFLDHYMWKLNPDFVFVSNTVLSPDNALTIGNQTFTSFRYLLQEGYRMVPRFDYSFWLEIAGACLPLLVTLLSWRLALLIPARTLELEARQQQQGVKETSYHHQQHLNESNTLQYFAAAEGNTNFQMAPLAPNSASVYTSNDTSGSASSSASAYSSDPITSTPSVTVRHPPAAAVGRHITPAHQKEVLY